jgi:hypothetical protein
VGKTTLAHEYCPEYRYINFDDNSLLDTAKRDPIGFVLIPIPTIHRYKNRPFFRLALLLILPIGRAITCNQR